MSQNFEEKLNSVLEKQPKEAIHEFLNDVYDYIGFVNKVSELIRLSEGIGTEQLDKDITVADVMLTMVRKGEQLHTTAEIMHEYASHIED
ncbi:MAG: hypothetical protein Phog2KO_34080 [Phototrophicaceae bacterium]